jgi:hypothetical protein
MAAEWIAPPITATATGPHGPRAPPGRNVTERRGGCDGEAQPESDLRRARPTRVKKNPRDATGEPPAGEAVPSQVRGRTSPGSFERSGSPGARRPLRPPPSRPSLRASDGAWSGSSSGRREELRQTARTRGTTAGEADTVRVLDKDQLRGTVDKSHPGSGAGADQVPKPAPGVRYEESEVVELGAAAERFIERGPLRVVVEFDPVVGAGIDEVDPLSSVGEPPLPDDAEPDRSVEPHRPREVPHADA